MSDQPTCPRLYRHLIAILSFLFFFSFAPHIYAATSFTFTLGGSARTSAGIYNSSGVLLRTLWSGITYGAGSHTATWDGTDDQGHLIPSGTYTARVLSNNVNYTWEGVIGNTSDVMAGPTVMAGMTFIRDMAFGATTGYTSNGYGEQASVTNKFTISNPQSITRLLGNVASAESDLVATDGTTVYWAEQDSFGVNLTFVCGTKVSDDSEVTFSSGALASPTYGRSYPSAIDIKNTANSLITGLAVQKNGNYLFVARSGLNQVDVVNKTTGALVQTLSITAPGNLAVDASDNLWMITSGTTVAKYTVNSDGTLSTATLTLAGLVAPLAVAASPDGVTVAVADGGSSQQVKAYNGTTGVSVWTLGQAGGYANGPAVANDKFMFVDNTKYNTNSIFTFITFAPDGSFWVGDTGNYRAQHYTSGQTFIDRIMYMGRFYASSVDPNNTSRVFGDFLEFHIDYSKPLSPTNGSWTLVNNWAYNIASGYNSPYFRIYNVTTLSNGRTYGFVFDGTQLALVELTAGGLRFTGWDTPDQSYSIFPDGSLRWVSGNRTGQVQVWNEKLLTGFDTSNNPTWGSATTLGSTPVLTNLDPNHFGSGNYSSPITSSNILVSFNAQLPFSGVGNDGYHLGGVQAGSNTWLWRTASSTYSAYQGPFPSDGTYDIGNGSQYGGSKALTVGRNIFWGFHGEFWKNGQTNEWNQVYDDGLFIGQFGTTRDIVFGQPASAEMAGNSFAGSLVTGSDGNVYLYHNDESDHGGVHRWKITGLNTIAEQNISVTAASPTGLLAQYYNGASINTAALATTRVDAVVNLLTNPINTLLNDVTSFSARFSGFVTPEYSETYTFYVGTNSGVRVWVDNTLLIDQWNNTSTTQFSGTIPLSAGTSYPIRIEYNNTATASLSLSWSSPSQAKQIIPSANLAPASIPDTTDGIDLMDGLPFAATLVDGEYGWNRNPTAQDTTSARYIKYWNVRTGSMSYNNIMSQDVQASFAQSSGITDTVSRDLGANSGLTLWKLSGDINFQGNVAFNTNEASYLDVLDSAGKIIARFSVAQGANARGNTPLTILGNTAAITQGTIDSLMRNVLYQNQPLTISASGGSIIFSYGGYTPVTTTVFDPTSDWQSPKTMRMLFSGSNLQLTNYSMDVSNLHFLTSAPTAPILSTTSVTSLPSGTTSTSLAITTNVSSMCSYSTTPNTAYASMTPFDTNGGTSHTTALTGLLDGNTYTYYIRCSDTSHNTNTSDYSVSFNVASAAPDTTPPAISAISSGTPGQTSTTISWTTDEASDSQVTYGPTTAYGTTTTLNTTLVTTHSVTLSGLSANTLYHYEVVSKDAAGNITIGTDHTFTTTAAPDITAPTVSLTAPANGSNLLGTITLSATASDNVGVVGVQFNIDGTPAQSEDTSAPYAIDYNTTALSGGSHTLSATARDAAGNRTTSTVFTVTVNNTPPDTTPPTISAISSGTPTQTATTITWTTNEAADSRILYGTTSSYGSATTLNASLVTTHTAAVSGLSSGTLYHYQIVSKDASGNTATTTDSTFTTASAPDTTAPVISAISSGTPGQTSTTISWTTDEASDSQVTYGPTTAYGSTTTLNTTLVTTHSVTLSGLSANTLYHYEVVSKDAAANTATSTDNTFTTTIIPDIIAPTIVMVTPLDLSTISGTNTLSVLALDDVGISGVQFNLDGSPLQSEVTAAPYTINLDTTTLSAGSHTLSATARDAAGNHTTSLPISVVVNNVVVSSGGGGGGGSYVPPVSSGGGGGGGSYIPPVTTTTSTTTVALASDCLGTTAFSALLGTPCANFNQPTSPTTTTTPSTTISTGAKVRVNVTSNSLLVRSTIGGSIAGYVSDNTIGTVLDTVASINGLSWVQVKFPKVTGWASSTYLAPTGGNTIVTTTPTIISTLPVTSTAKPVAVAPNAARVKVNVTSDSLRLRSTIGGTIAGYVANKTVGTVLQTIPSINGLSWVQVKFPKATGWTSSTYLASVSPSTSVATTTPTKTVKKAGPVVTTATVTTAVPKPAATTTLATTTTPTVPSTGRKVVVTASSISVYPFPSTSSATVTVPRFTQGTVNTTIDGWISVVFSNGVKGWILQSGVLVY